MQSPVPIMDERTRPPEIRFAILAVDVALISVMDREVRVLLMPVNMPPDFVGMRGLPGGLIRPDETAEDAATRHLTEKCGIRGVYAEQLYTFSGINRDPRGRVVSVAYIALMPEAKARAVKLPEGLVWERVNRLGRLAYDHNEIVAVALERLGSRMQSTTIARHLVSGSFTLPELQQVYETVLQMRLDKRNFRKKLIGDGIVKATGEQLRAAVGRPAELYRFRASGVIDIGILPAP
jgi:8-oxo-dGTP diphosphatase